MGVDKDSSADKAQQLQMLLSYLLQIEPTKIRVDEKYILNDNLFVESMEWARLQLGLTNDTHLTPDNVYETVLSRFLHTEAEKLNPTMADKRNAFENFKSIARQARKKARLPRGWQSYVQTYILYGEVPQLVQVKERQLISVEKVDGTNNSLIVRLKPGLKKTDYVKAWKAFEGFLSENSVYKPYAVTLKQKIYIDRRNGMSYKQLADKYFPDEADRVATRDKVKKIYKREADKSIN